MFSLSIYHSKLKSQWDNFIDKSKNGTFLFQRDFLEYHKDQYEDYSILFYKDNDVVAVFPANKINSSIYSHQGLTYGGLIIGSHIPHLFSQEEKPNQEEQTLMLSIFLADTESNPSIYDFEEFLFLKSLAESSETPFVIRPSSSFISDFKYLNRIDETSRLLQMMQILSQIKEFPQRKIRLANKVRVKEKEGKRLNAIIQFMVNSKEQTLSLKEVSEVANLTPTSFCRFFKKHTNKSFREFYRELKMQKAAQSLLYNPNIPIQDIASKSGYFNISSFNRNFKQVFDRSPSDYRKLYVKN